MASVTWRGAYATNVDVRSAKTTSITTTDSLSDLNNNRANLTSLTVNLTLRTNAYRRTYSLTISLLSNETVITTKTVSVKLPGSGNQKYSTTFDLTGLTGETIAQINKLRLQAPAVSSGYLYTSTGSQEITLQYTPITLTAPDNIKITQHETNSTYNISWDKAAGSGGSDTTIKYNVYYGKSVSETDAATNLVPGGSGITGTSISNITLPGYGLYDFKVEALYSGITASLSVAEEFYGPSVTIPSTAPTISPTTGDSVTLSWKAGSYSHTGGDAIQYQVRYILDNNSEASYDTNPVSGTSLTITSNWLEGKGAKDGSVIKFRVRARGGANLTNNLENKTYIYSNYTSYSNNFTYDGKYTVGYNDGTKWQACVVYYNDGTTWVECIPYYNDGSTWQPIKTKV